MFLEEKESFLLLMIVLMQGLGPYSTLIKKAEKEIKEMAKKVNDLCGMYPLPTLTIEFLLCRIRFVRIGKLFDVFGDMACNCSTGFLGPD